MLWGRNYTLGKGGLHADQENEIWEAIDGMLIEDDDVSSYYPSIIVNNRIYPYHLGVKLLTIYEGMYHKRIELKPLSKKDKKIKGIVNAYKLVLNSIFGKMGSMESWLYDMKALLSVTLTGELSLLMLLEMFEMNGIHVISANTDGLTSRFPKEKKELKDRLVKEWMELTNFEMETESFKKFYYSTVNDYFAIKENGSIKQKGDFITDFELWKNKSFKVIPMAMTAYFKDGTDPISFIRNHKNIFDFCGMTRATGQMHLEMQKSGKYEVTPQMLEADGWEQKKDKWRTGKETYVCFEEAVQAYRDAHPTEVVELRKLVRYYFSDKDKWLLFKRGIGTTGKKANISVNADNEVGRHYVAYYNTHTALPFEQYEINLNHYIYKTLKLIDKVEKTKKAEAFVDSLKPTKQLTLW